MADEIRTEDEPGPDQISESPEADEEQTVAFRDGTSNT
jgi:hypothetical protein